MQAMQTLRDGAGTGMCTFGIDPVYRDWHAGSHEIKPPAEVLNPRMPLCAAPPSHVTKQDYQTVNTSAAEGDSHSLEYALHPPPWSALEHCVNGLIPEHQQSSGL